MRKTLIMGGVALSAIAALLAGCSSESHDMSSMPSTTSMPGMPGMSGTAPAADHNQQDATFAQEMSVHHSQALDMAKLAPTRSTDPKVLALAARIEKAQDPEIQQMQGWLTKWGMPGSMPMDHGSMPMDHGSMPGVMSDADMAKLEQARGAEFDRLFLQQMIQHHQGAIEMAKTELAQGSNADAKALAQKIIDAQTAEIAEMQAMLG
jgi:uncharacterized protein (DUF305 family)